MIIIIILPEIEIDIHAMNTHEERERDKQISDLLISKFQSLIVKNKMVFMNENFEGNVCFAKNRKKKLICFS